MNNDSKDSMVSGNEILTMCSQWNDKMKKKTQETKLTIYGVSL